jgi:hypothetical protein
MFHWLEAKRETTTKRSDMMDDTPRNEFGFRFISAELRGTGWALLAAACLIGATALVLTHILSLLALPLMVGAVFAGYKYREASRDYWEPIFHSIRRGINQYSGKEAQTNEMSVSQPTPPAVIDPASQPAAAALAPQPELKWQKQYATQKAAIAQQQK